MDQLANHLVAGDLVLATGGLEIASAQAVTAVQVEIVYHRRVLRRSRFADPRVASRVELADNCGYVRGRLGRLHRSRRGRDCQNLQSGVKQGDTQGHGIVDPRITIDDNLASHATSLEPLRLAYDPELRVKERRR